METSLDEATTDHKNHRDLKGNLIICEPRAIQTSVLKQSCMRVNIFVGTPVLAIDWYWVPAWPTLQHHEPLPLKRYNNNTMVKQVAHMRLGNTLTFNQPSGTNKVSI